MSKTYFFQLLFFIGALSLLSVFFHLNISILGSLALTIASYLLFDTVQTGYG